MFLSNPIVFYALVIILASLLGGWLPTRMRLTHTGNQLLMSFVAGLMLGIACYHLIPHAAATLPQGYGIDTVMWWLMLGLLLMFVLLRAFHFHQRDAVEVEGHNPHCQHHHHGKAFSWMGVALGLGLHSLMDGLALGAAVRADQLAVDHGVAIAGLGVFIAVLLHKPLDAMSIASLMLAAGVKPAARWLVTMAFALLCPLGALLFLSGIEHFQGDQNWLVGIALAFAAGLFICISLSDLLPEVQFHAHDRGKLTAALLAGVAAAYAIGLVEGEHAHDDSHKLQNEPHQSHPQASHHHQ